MNIRANLSAKRIALLSYVLSNLTVALLLSPLIATHVDFGHKHAPGKPVHVHSISSVITPLLSPITLPLTRQTLVFDDTFFLAVTPNVTHISVAGLYQRAPPAPIMTR